ncbi:Uncharacterized protein APZ42_020486, partial [Daphnia magna]
LITPIDWYNFCREVSEDIVINNFEKIGGVGITVEIDESKFGKSNLLDALIMEHNNYIHLKVNHSLHFKDPKNGAHTNQIEGKFIYI